MNQPPPDNYQPGACNIGIREVAVRKKFFWFFLFITVLLSIVSSWYAESFFWWLLLLFSVFLVIVLHLEIKYRFCILFAFFGLYNFGKLGNLHEVRNKEHTEKDRKRVLQIVIKSLFVSLVYATFVHVVASYIH